ncbi:MAG TPA: hypothetical protein VHV26_01615 [Rhizomicrobium sp.]|jgi:hypothetical protein|nr:hypothetical protein [Rhizomicrobium sp.]
MSQTTLDPVGAAPETRRITFILLLFGATVAPIFWLGQLMLGYWATAIGCYSGDHPAASVPTQTIVNALIAFDIVALLACAASAAVSWRSWRHTRHEKGGDHSYALHTGEGRSRFLALWGMFSSLWFFGAVLFNTIASLTVPPCGV